MLKDYRKWAAEKANGKAGEGRQEGQHAEALRIAQRMLADGIARETVVKITGLTADGSPRWRIDNAGAA